MAPGASQASDDAFTSYSFAIVSVICICYYIPWAIRTVREIIIYRNADKREKADLTNPLQAISSACRSFPRMVVRVLTHPQEIVEGAKLMWKEKSFFFKRIAPRSAKYVLRPSIFLPFLWLFMFSSVMYISLTFDPHQILGIPSTSSVSDVKKAYRSLARRYHPDHNKTDEAKVIFTQIRRAYKALVDRDAFEEEEAKSAQNFSVGVALPSFLLSRDHDGLVLFGLLGILFAAPFIVWRFLRETNKLEKLIKHISLDKTVTESFVKHFGVPEDAKYAERRLSRKTILRELVQLGIVASNVPDTAIEKFPPFPDFLQRCVDAEHQKAFLINLGFDEQTIQILQAHMVANGMKLLEGFEAAHAKMLDEQEAMSSVSVPPSRYEVLYYFYEFHLRDVDGSLQQLLELNDSIASAKKLLRLHKETLDNLKLLSTSPKGTKNSKNALVQLSQAPQRTAELVEGIQQELLAIFRRNFRAEMEWKSSKREMRAYKKTQR